MARELAASFASERHELAQQDVEDDALVRYCRVPTREITRLRAVPYSAKQRALQIAGRFAALLMLGDTCWLAADGDAQSGVMPEDEAGAQQSNIALAVGGIVADELIACTPLRLAAVRGRAQLLYLDLCEPSPGTPSQLFDCFRRYYAEQFLPHTPAITTLASELCRATPTSNELTQFSKRWDLRAQLKARAA
ncbi:MAG: hypothetical protein ACRECQ_15630 [Burkholderiaceae bacterium]